MLIGRGRGQGCPWADKQHWPLELLEQKLANFSVKGQRVNIKIYLAFRHISESSHRHCGHEWMLVVFQ